MPLPGIGAKQGVPQKSVPLLPSKQGEGRDEGSGKLLTIGGSGNAVHAKLRGL